MTMRSMPPASSHLADSPVPAPPPTIGSPRAIMPRNFSRIWARGIAMLRVLAGAGGAVQLVSWPRPSGGAPRPVQRAVGGDGGGGESGIVDVVRLADDLARRGLAHRRLQRGEARGVGGGIVEGLAGGVERRDAALRQEEAHRRLHQVQPL